MELVADLESMLMAAFPPAGDLSALRTAAPWSKGRRPRPRSNLEAKRKVSKPSSSTAVPPFAPLSSLSHVPLVPRRYSSGAWLPHFPPEPGVWEPPKDLFLSDGEVRERFGAQGGSLSTPLSTSTSSRDPDMVVVRREAMQAVDREGQDAGEHVASAETTGSNAHGAGTRSDAAAALTAPSAPLPFTSAPLAATFPISARSGRTSPASTASSSLLAASSVRAPSDSHASYEERVSYGDKGGWSSRVRVSSRSHEHGPWRVQQTSWTVVQGVGLDEPSHDGRVRICQVETHPVAAPHPSPPRAPFSPLGPVAALLCCAWLAPATALCAQLPHSTLRVGVESVGVALAWPALAPFSPSLRLEVRRACRRASACCAEALGKASVRGAEALGRTLGVVWSASEQLAIWLHARGAEALAASAGGVGLWERAGGAARGAFGVGSEIAAMSRSQIKRLAARTPRTIERYLESAPKGVARVARATREGIKTLWDSFRAGLGRCK